MKASNLLFPSVKISIWFRAKSLVILLAEKQVENKSAYGNENQYDNPCKAFYRIAIFEYDDDDCKNDRQDKSRVDPGI